MDCNAQLNFIRNIAKTCIDMAAKCVKVVVMQSRRIHKVEVYAKSHSKVRQFAKRNHLSIADAYEALTNFGVDALERQMTLMRRLPVASFKGVNDATPF